MWQFRQRIGTIALIGSLRLIRQVWHCQPCSYDLCDNCIRPTEVQTPLPSVRDFNESEFKNRVATALTRVRTILENARTPTLASEVQHEYDDKVCLCCRAITCI